MQEKNERPMSELLPWLFLSDDGATVVCKDSSLLAVFVIQGVDGESADAYGLDDAAFQFDSALRFAAAQDIRFWTRADRFPVNSYLRGDFANPMANDIDELWGETFENSGVFKNQQIIAIAMPTQKRSRTVAEMARDKIDDGEPLWSALPTAIWNRVRSTPKDQIGFETPEELENARMRFEQNVIAPMLQQLHRFQLHRLTNEELCGQLRAATSERPPGPVAVTEFTYLDSALSETWIDNSFRDQLVLNGLETSHVAILTLKVAPSANKLAALDTLMALPMRLTVATCWKASTNDRAIKDLKGARTFDEMRRMDMKSLLRSAVRNDVEALDSDASASTKIGQAAEQHIADLKDGTTRWGYLACTVMVYAPSSVILKRNLELVQSILDQKELSFLREREGAISGFAVGIPGNVTDPLRWFHCEASNVTDLAPIITLDEGAPHHPHYSGLYRSPMPPAATMRSRYNTVQHVNLHVGALAHTLMVGPSNAGKTLAKMFLTSQMFKYPGARTVIFDKDYSCEAATLTHDGDCVDLTPGAVNSARMNPLSYASDPSARPFLVSWIDRLMTARGNPLSDTELEEVSKAITQLSGLAQARLTSLQSQLPAALKERLAPWCQGGVWGEYFDNADDELSFSSMTCFELGGLMAANLTDVLRAFTDYVFFRIEKLVSDTEKIGGVVGPTEIYFEEAGYLLEDPRFSAKAVDYLTTLRKKLAHLVMTAQSPEPFVRDARLRAAVRDNIATVIFLPNQAAGRPELGDMYKLAFGVNDNHLSLIANAIPRREYCIWQPQRGVFRVAVLNLPTSIIARLMSDKTSRAILNETYTSGNPAWKQKYIARLTETLNHSSKGRSS